MYCFKIMSLFAITLLFLGCEQSWDKEYVILLKNQSNHRINCYENRVSSKSIYPDTLIAETEFVWDIVSGENFSFTSKKPWEKVFESLPSDTLSIFIFHTDTIKNNSWNSIIDEYKVLKRYDLSIKDIQLLNYEIPYPPTEVMRGMRMYPRYEQ